MEAARVKAVLFVKHLEEVAAFYSKALEMKVISSDEHHSVLACDGFELVVHQIPRHIAEGIVIEQPPKRRVQAAIRLDYRVSNIERSRETARALGGEIDDVPPPWAERGARFFFGYDPEGNQFGVGERAA